MKATKSTIKSFIRKNAENLFINVKYSFDGMTDCCQPENNGFQKAQPDSDEFYNQHTLGIAGAWFVGQSRDYFTPYNEKGFIGYEVSNCCGHFILAVKQPQKDSYMSKGFCTPETTKRNIPVF